MKLSSNWRPPYVPSASLSTLAKPYPSCFNPPTMISCILHLSLRRIPLSSTLRTSLILHQIGHGDNDLLFPPHTTSKATHEAIQLEQSSWAFNFSSIHVTANINCIQSKLESLGSHYNLGHVGMHKMKYFMSSPRNKVDNKETEWYFKKPCIIPLVCKHAKSCAVQKYAPCILGKMEKFCVSIAPWRKMNHSHSLKENDLLPGSRIFMD